MSASTESFYEITKSMTYKNPKDADIATIDSQKETITEVELENVEDYSSWIVQNSIFKSSEANPKLILSVLGNLIGAKFVEEKAVTKATKKTKKEEGEQEEEPEEEQATDSVKYYGGYYLSMVDLAASFEVDEKNLKSWATTIDKFTATRKIIESSVWLHISALPAFLTTFAKNHKDVIAEAFNTIALAPKIDIENLRLDALKNKRTNKLLGKGFIIKPKEIKKEATGPDANKIILITVHKDEGYIIVSTTKTLGADRNIKSLSKKGEFPCYQYQTNNPDVATKIINKYLEEVKHLNPIEGMKGVDDEGNEIIKKQIGKSYIYYDEGIPETEEEALAIFDEFTAEYIEANIAKKTPKAPKAKSDATVSKPKQAKPVAKTATKKEPQVKPVAKQTKPAAKQTKPAAKTTKPAENKGNTPVQKSSEDEEAFNW